MQSLVDMKKHYVRLYSELRKYVWDFATVSRLADFEIAVYRRFPDLAEIKNRYESLYSCISDVCRDDEDLDLAARNMRNIINSTTEFYSKIDKPKEV